MMEKDRPAFRRAWLPAMAAFALLLAGLLAGCAGTDNAANKAQPLSETTPTPIAATPTPEPTPAPPQFTAPLTGLPLSREAAERPIAVMVNNFSLAPRRGRPSTDLAGAK